MVDYFGGMEGGGTKFICAVCDDTYNIVNKIQFPTASPEETLGQCISFFKKFELKALGLGVFGPLNLDTSSPGYGSITTTPKPRWSGTNIFTTFHNEFSLPIAIDLDVNAAVLGEYYLVPQNSQFTSLVYITIGTGIGAGIITNKSVLHGLSHPEIGHMHIPHIKEDPFPGLCIFHKDCLEGLASGTAISSRWKRSPVDIPDDHPAWDLEAGYLAFALANIILVISPQKIILGGGVMNKTILFPLIREKVKLILNNYLLFPEICSQIDKFITPPCLGNTSGVMGALFMARNIFQISHD